jgi:hypothetical protein
MNEQVLYAPEYLSLSGDQAAPAAKKIITEIGDGQPCELRVDGEKLDVAPSEIPAQVDRCTNVVTCSWKSPRRQVTYQCPNLIKLSRHKSLPDVARSLTLLKSVPIDVAVGGPRFLGWTQPESSQEYVGPVVEPGHYPYGWMLGFKGDGHRHLVSQRWLDYCPARIVRDGDITLIQFHDLNADPQTAAAQAAPGHRWMNDQPGGGFVRSDLKPLEDATGLYDAEKRTLYITVTGRDLTPREVAEACTRRNFGERRGQKPVDRLIYVFVEEDRGRRHVHDLWLRGIECRTFVNGKEVTLTDAYAPPAPVVPDWVKRF